MGAWSTANWIMPGISRQNIKYPDYRDNMALDCDLILWQPTTWYGRFICAGTLGPFCHVSAVINFEGRLVQCGYEEHRDGVFTLLGPEVDRYPGKLSVFRVNIPPGEIQRLRARIIDNLGARYSWHGIYVQVIGHMLGMGLFTWTSWYRRAVWKASKNTASAFCSQYLARCFEESGLPFQHKPTAEINPNDIARAGIVNYVGTLVPNGGDRK